MAAEDHLSKKQQHNHKGIYFMICNEVQILPTTLNNQSKPNFPSLEGQRVYKSRTNRKRSVSLLIHTNFPGSNSDELWYHPCFFKRKTKAQTSHLFLHSKLIRKLKGRLAHRCPRCSKNSSQNFFPPTAQMSSAIWDTAGSSGLWRRAQVYCRLSHLPACICPRYL